jgi:hypothetical protein
MTESKMSDEELKLFIDEFEQRAIFYHIDSEDEENEKDFFYVRANLFNELAKGRSAMELIQTIKFEVENKIIVRKVKWYKFFKFKKFIFGDMSNMITTSDIVINYPIMYRSTSR